jgi:ornithine cyclodeaminase
LVLRFDDEDLNRLGRRGAIDGMRSFFSAAAAGRTASPPRVSVEVGSRRLVFTVGGDLERGVAGFRVYSVGSAGRARGGAPAGPDQHVVLLDVATGEILATADGPAFGAWRTAAIGGVALEEALRGRTTSGPAAVVGAGFQAHHHARTWAATGLVSEFRVFARDLGAAREFAERLAAEGGIPAGAAGTAPEALAGAVAVLCATSSATPVFTAEALDAEAYVATVGPKFGGRNEVPQAVYARAALFTDAPAQILEYEASVGPLPAGRRAAEALSLADLVAGQASLPARGTRLFVSEGLAGTEVALLDALRRQRG